MLSLRYHNIIGKAEEYKDKNIGWFMIICCEWQNTTWHDFKKCSNINEISYWKWQWGLFPTILRRRIIKNVKDW